MPAKTNGAFARRLPVGCETSATEAHFRVWAPKCRTVEVVIEGPVANSFHLAHEEDGHFSGGSETARTGDRYRFRLDGGFELLPDPCSRFQPNGPHGPSEIIDNTSFAWTDQAWKGAALPNQVIYELHVGTFTREGTWAAAAKELPELADLGVTLIEVLPIAEFAGRFGWGYDGVSWFAPTRLYGRPDDFRAFVDRAHSVGVGVILDVVYNHVGPEGNYLSRFDDGYFSTARRTEWGAAINYDEGARPARELAICNARYWIDEFHLDGLRLDATQSIFDDSERHVLAEIAGAVREAGGSRETVIVAENEPQHAKLVRAPERGGYGLDALWNDDYHHVAMVALTGRREAYYTDYRGTAQEFVSCIKSGYLYQGQRYSWQKAPRGKPALDIEPPAFVTFLQNHDQVANTRQGLRVHALTSPGKYRALTALTLLGPNTPMLFQGQEFAASTPFLYFADHDGSLSRSVRDGRREFLRQFPSLALPSAQETLPDPALRETFERCKLDTTERHTHHEIYQLHRDLLRLRRTDPVLRTTRRRGSVDGFVLRDETFGIRFFDGDEHRLLMVNLGGQLDLPAVSDPLFAPPEDASWRIMWSSNDVRYGGDGTTDVENEGGITLSSECAIFLGSLRG